MLGYPGAIEESRQNNKRQRDETEDSENEIENYTLTIEYALGNNTLTAITGVVGYDFYENCDCDFVAAPIFDVAIDEEYDQISQEIRLVSPGGETIDWIAGAFYQESELRYKDFLDVPSNSVLGSVSSALLPLTNTASDRTYDLDTDTWAVFGQATWNISDTWRVTLGGRYTEESKDAYRELNITNSDGSAVGPVAPFLWLAVFGIESQQSTGHLITGDRDEDDFTPSINVQWDVGDDTMLYASYATGFKSGGFDARANSVASWEFEGEEATTYELGAKSTFMDGAMELNGAIYFTEYDDLQIAQFDGTLGFNVGNAAETEVWGVEVDGRWAITDSLVAAYGLAYLDHEYTDYTNGNCYNRQVPDGDVVNGEQLCDYTGLSGQYTPEWSGYLSLNHTLPITGNLDLNSSFDLSYTDEQNTHVNLDPQWEVDAITVMNLRFGLYAQNWDVSVLVQNLSDEQQFTYVGNTPLSGSTFGTNTFYSFMSRPRTTYLQATWHF